MRLPGANLFRIVSSMEENVLFARESGKERGMGCTASNSVIELSKYEMEALGNTVAR